MISIKKIITVLIFLAIHPFLNAQTLQFQWQQCLGGSDEDNGHSILSTSNGYLLFCGSYSGDGQVPPTHGGDDFWLVRTDPQGVIQWSKTYGGSDEDYATKIVRWADKGYFLFGDTYSNDGNVSGNHGDGDYWVIKIDSTGNILWQKCFGGTSKEVANDMISTNDSGFLLIGCSLSTDGNVTGTHGFYDVWIVKLDLDGTMQWEKSLGGTSADVGISVKGTGDGGYIVGASTHSIDGDVSCNVHGDENWDAWIVKLDATGNMEWQQCYGGTKDDGPNDILQTSDGGYIFAGTTDSNDGDVSGNHGNNDIWVVKTDSVGTLQWQRCYGGTWDERAIFIRQTLSGNFIVGGITNSNDGDVSGNHSIGGGYDAWLLRISPAGDILWKQCLGGDNDDAFSDLIEFPDGEITLLGGSKTYDHTGDVQCDHHSAGRSDVWLTCVTDTTVIGIHGNPGDHPEVNVYPNPAGELINFRLTGSDCYCETKITLINVYGQIIEEVILPAGQHEISLSTSHIQRGFYTSIMTNRQLNEKRKITIN